MDTRRALRNGVIYLFVILLFGVAVPAAKGLGFFDPVLLSAYACLGIVFAGPAAAQAFEKRPASLAVALRWIVKAALFGEGIALAMVASGLTTVYLMNRSAFFRPDMETVGYALLLGLSGSLALAALAGWVRLELSSGAARMTMRLVFLGLMALFFFKGRWLPDVLEIGTLLCLAVAGLFLLLMRRRLA